MTLAIDFDGVIHDHRNPVPGRRMGPPIAGAKEALRALRAAGDRIVVYSVRLKDEAAKKHVADWLRFYEIGYDDLAIAKPNADIYLDDRAVRFTSWSDFFARHRGGERRCDT